MRLSSSEHLQFLGLNAPPNAQDKHVLEFALGRGTANEAWYRVTWEDYLCIELKAFGEQR